MNSYAIDWEKIFAISIYDKGLDCIQKCIKNSYSSIIKGQPKWKKMVKGLEKSIHQRRQE